MERKYKVGYLVFMGMFKVRAKCGHCGLDIMTGFQPIVEGQRFPVVHYCGKDFEKHEVKDFKNQTGIIFFPEVEGLITILSTMN